VPLVPEVITQVLPLQQSAVEVQTAPVPWHTTGVPQVPAVQICEQQSAENEQAPPLARHSGPASDMPASRLPASPGPSSSGRHTAPRWGIWRPTMVPAFMLSLLNRQRQLLGAKFFERYPSNWLVWEPGPWRPARSESTSNTESTQLPSPVPFAGPAGDDALCFELKRAVSELTVGRSTENHIVVNDLTVSRAQLRLEFAGGKWRVLTENLVMVDGQPVGTQGALLANASVIVIGAVRLTFYEPEGFLQRLELAA
jgi:hypothetical protein